MNNRNKLIGLTLTLAALTSLGEANPNKKSALSAAMSLFSSSSTEDFTMLTQEEKDMKLKEYASKEKPKLSLVFRWSIPEYFHPLKKNFQIIIDLIKNGASPNVDISYRWALFNDSWRGTFKPIYLFIATNDIENTRIMLEHGARIDQPIIKKNGLDKGKYALDIARSSQMTALLKEYDAQDHKQKTANDPRKPGVPDDSIRPNRE